MHLVEIVQLAVPSERCLTELSTVVIKSLSRPHNSSMQFHGDLYSSVKPYIRVNAPNMEDAVCSGNLQQVQELIRSGTNVNARCNLGVNTLLNLAVSRGHKDIVLVLLAAGADVKAKDSCGQTVLHKACDFTNQQREQGRSALKDIVLALLAAGADVHAKNMHGYTALHIACERQSEEVVQVLIDGGSRVDEVSLYRSPLVLARGNRAISMSLLRAGASCEGLSKEEKDRLFRHACHVDDPLAVDTLLKNGCSIGTLSREEQERLLRCAYHKHNLFVVGALLTNGCRISTLSREEEEELLHCACHEGDLLVARALLTRGCSVVVLSREEQEELLCCACLEGDLLLAGTLLKNGCKVSILSREEQRSLLCCACRKGDIPVARTLLQAICRASELTHTELVQVLNPLPKQEKEGLLYGACIEGDMLVVEALIAVGCSVNFVGFTGVTPLMNAAYEGHEEIVKKLILAGANLAMKDENGNTALHYAAIHNHIQCGVLLAEGGASVRTTNNLSQTPLDIAKSDFQEAIKQALLFTTRKTLCVIGNAEGGKSTLIASLQAESNSFFGRIFNRFRRVDDCRNRTAGIETVPHSSQKYGEVLFFDFAGQDDYHGPHQMFMESLLSKPGVSMTILLVIKVTEPEDTILHQLHRWLTPVALMSTTASPPHVIVIGSFLDKVQSKQEATDKLMRCIEATKSNLEELPLRFVGTCFLNCRQPQSEGIDQLCGFLQDVPILEFSTTHTGYCLAWVLSQMKSSMKAQALQLQEFSRWIEDNKANLPQTIPTPEEVCQDLSAAGHALYIPNRETPSKSWLVLDLPAILHNVYGTLFAQFKEIVNDFGLLHCRGLAELFPHMDLAMIEQLLISLEFCIPVEPLILNVDLSKLTDSNETSGWRFFPSLISTKPSQSHSKILPKQSVHCLCWQLRTSMKHSISARILQTILLRLAAHFVVKQHDEEGVQQHYCSIWWNGITWQSIVGVSTTVHITNNRVIQVTATSKIANVLHEYLSDIISDILSTVHRLSPNLSASAYIVHPPDVDTSAEDITGRSPKELFPMEGVRESSRKQEGVVFSLKDNGNWNTVSLAELFGGFTPTLEYIEKISWTQPGLSQPQSPTELNQSTEGNGVLTDSKVVSHGAQTVLEILSTPDLRDVHELVVTAVAANWERLALELGVKDCVIKIVSKDHPNDCIGACLDFLSRWLRGEQHTGERERLWCTLLTVLGRAGFAELERSLLRKHFTKHSFP